MMLPRMHAQRGMSLVVSLLMLIAILALGISAAQMALQGEKASRNDRDHQIAFQAAEAALMDAELDIQNASGGSSRSSMFQPDSTLGFTAGCGAGTSNTNLGLCQAAPEGATPVWESIDFLDASDDAKSVPYGHFTGQSFPIEKGSLPSRLPRYIIEILPYTAPSAGATSSEMTYIYRVTAIGFGMRDSTQVVLQTFYYKEGI